MRYTLKLSPMLQITPSGYAHMTHMLNALSGGKLLVILEGGYAFTPFILNCIMICFVFS